MKKLVTINYDRMWFDLQEVSMFRYSFWYYKTVSMIHYLTKEWNIFWLMGLEVENSKNRGEVAVLSLLKLSCGFYLLLKAAKQENAWEKESHQECHNGVHWSGKNISSSKQSHHIRGYILWTGTMVIKFIQSNSEGDNGISTIEFRTAKPQKWWWRHLLMRGREENIIHWF